MSLKISLFAQVSDSGFHGSLVSFFVDNRITFTRFLVFSHCEMFALALYLSWQFSHGRRAVHVISKVDQVAQELSCLTVSKRP